MDHRNDEGFRIVKYLTFTTVGTLLTIYGAAKLPQYLANEISNSTYQSMREAGEACSKWISKGKAYTVDYAGTSRSHLSREAYWKRTCDLEASTRQYIGSVITGLPEPPSESTYIMRSNMDDCDFGGNIDTLIKRGNCTPYPLEIRSRFRY